MNEMSLAVVGLDFPNDDASNRRFEAALCERGDPVHLALHPRNKHDPLAVAVVSSRGIQLGYLTAERCGYIGNRIRQCQKFEAFFQDHGRSAVIRIRFGGGRPTMPAPRRIAEPPGDSDAWDHTDWGA